ncbi:MAG: HAD hydrolase-like protein [Patescibacteria group bacterium]
MFKVIVFDFDGVLVDSNRIKDEAWSDVFGDLPENEKQVALELFPKVAVRTRYVILDEIFRALGRRDAERITLIRAHAEKYNQITQTGILRKGLIGGVWEALEELSKKYKLYLNSSTPIEALGESVDNLGIGKFFAEIFGRPETKESALEKIFALEQVGGNQTGFVGDGEPDRVAAEAYGCFFIGILSGFTNWTKNEKFVTIDSVRDVPEIITRKESDE